MAAETQFFAFALSQENLRCAQIGLAERSLRVDALYEGVGLVFGESDLSSRAVVFEASAKQLLPAGEQGGCKRVALESLVHLSVEQKAYGTIASNARGRTQTLLFDAKGLEDGHKLSFYLFSFYFCVLTVFLSAAP